MAGNDFCVIIFVVVSLLTITRWLPQLQTSFPYTSVLRKNGQVERGFPFTREENLP